MKSLLIKDYYVITKQLKIFILLIPVFAIFTQGELSFFAILLGAALPMTAIAYDERSRWNEYAKMMPFSIDELVISKYLLGYCCIIGAAILSLLGQIIGKQVGLESEQLMIILLLYALISALLYIAISMPLFFRFGSEKARFVFIAAMVLASITGSLLNKEMLHRMINISPAILFAIVILLNGISILISIRVEKNRLVDKQFMKY